MIDYDEDDDPSEALFACEGGPWNGKLIKLGDDPTTMVFRLGDWRGRYVVPPVHTWQLERPKPAARWEDAPRQS